MGVLNDWQITFYGTAFDPQPGTPIRPPVLVDVAEDDDAAAEQDVEDQPQISVDEVEIPEDVEILDGAIDESEQTTPFGASGNFEENFDPKNFEEVSGNLEILNER